MYNYDFKNEKVIYEKQKCFADISGKELFVNVVITEKNLLLFYNVQDFISMKTQGILVMPNNDLIVGIDITDLNYEVDSNNTLINNGEIILFDFLIDEILDSVEL